jgi:hypothetical protein
VASLQNSNTARTTFVNNTNVNINVNNKVILILFFRVLFFFCTIVFTKVVFNSLAASSLLCRCVDVGNDDTAAVGRLLVAALLDRRTDNVIDLGENLLKCKLDVGRVESRRLDEREAVLLGVRRRLLGRTLSLRSQIAFVAHQHNDNVRVGVIAQLGEPSIYILKRLLLRDVVHQQRADGAAVVRRRDRTIALLARSVPDLRLDRFRFARHRARRKLDANRRLALHVEFVARESRQKVRLADATITNQNNYERGEKKK